MSVCRPETYWKHIESGRPFPTCKELGSNNDQPRLQKLPHAASRQMQTCRSISPRDLVIIDHYRTSAFDQVCRSQSLKSERPLLRKVLLAFGGFEGLSKGTFPHSATQHASCIPGMHGSFSNWYPRFYGPSDSLACLARNHWNDGRSLSSG